MSVYARVCVYVCVCADQRHLRRMVRSLPPEVRVPKVLLRLRTVVILPMCLRFVQLRGDSLASIGADAEGEEDADVGWEASESGGTGEGRAPRETVSPRNTTSPVEMVAAPPPDAPPTRPLIGSTFSRGVRAMRRKSEAELWSIDHVNALDKWIAQQVWVSFL